MKQDTKQEAKIWTAIVAIILITIISAVAVNAQGWKKGLAVVGYHTATIALGAIADAQYDMGNKEWSHALHAAEVGALIGGPFIFKPKGTSEIASYILSYGFIRFSFFDGFYNMTRDLPINYVGSTSGYDKFMSKVPPDGRAFMKSWSLVLGVSIPLTSF